MMSRKQYLRRRYTLVEIILALGVFSILLLVMMQFFSGAQRLWTGSESRVRTYADARVAMDLMAMQLQNIVYSPDREGVFDDGSSNRNYFRLDQSSGNVRLSFPTLSPFKLDNSAQSSLYTVLYTYERQNSPDDFNKNKLVLARISDRLNPDGATSGEVAAVVQGVTDLRFTPLRRTGDDLEEVTTWPDDCLPEAIQISLTMLSQNDFERYKALSGSSSKQEEFLANNQKTFTRTVYLGNRAQ